MSKASLLALIIFLNANPEAISKKNDDEKEEATKIENIESIIDNIVSSYEVSEEDFEKVNPLENLKIEDEDFFLRGNREIIEKYEIKVEQKFIEIGQEKFLINILSKEGPNNQKYFICHDSEDASFDTAIRAIKNGGEVISLGNDENRFLFNYNEPKGLTNQDPNRMFSENNPYWPMAEKVLDLLESENKEMIIALHNNSPHGNFHLDNIKNWRNISIISEEDPNKKSLIWIPGLERNPSDELLEEIEYYKKNGLNVVYEYVPENQEGDGSFSVWAAKNNIPYRNIEIMAAIKGNEASEKKALEDQQRYLQVLKDYHNIDKSKDAYALKTN